MDSVKFEVWDLGGQAALRLSWQAYYPATDAVIVVVDSTDRGRIGIARQELKNIIDNPSLKGACILIFANKQVKLACLGSACWKIAVDRRCTLAILAHPHAYVVSFPLQDLPNAMSVQELSEALDLVGIKDHNWHVQVRKCFVVALDLSRNSAANRDKQALHLAPETYINPTSPPATQASCAVSGQGLEEGVQWIARHVKAQNAPLFSLPSLT